MDFFEKVGETLSTVGREATDKAKALAELAGLKSQIHTCDEVMRKNYIEIGKIYYENFGENPEELFVKQCKAIANAQEGKRALEEKVSEIRRTEPKEAKEEATEETTAETMNE